MEREQGLIHPLLITTIVFGVLTLGFAGFSIWAYTSYVDHRDNVDAKVAIAVEDAKQEQIEVDEADFLEREKLPTRQLTGPEDLGRVSLSYPKTWSVYLDENGADGEYEAYLAPGLVQPVDSNSPNALRVTVTSDAYDDVLDEYSMSIDDGELSATAVAVQGVNGVRLAGTFSEWAKGAMVVLKIRDKTLQVYTEDTAYLSDFDDIVLKSLNFNK